MTIYDEEKIWQLFSASNRAAIRYLKQLKVFCGNEPSFPGLSGWIYEQTIQYCVKRELRAKKIKVDISEQAKLGSRGRADLQIGDRAVIEIKLSGLFSKEDIIKHQRYRQFANAAGLEYLYITRGEGYQPYRDGVDKVLGEDNTFFLDTSGEWRRFCKRLVQLLR